MSYDSQGRGWTGSPVRTEECLDRLRRVDTESKIEWMPDRLASRSSSDYVAADTRQRQQRIEQQASPGADWVSQIDTDETCPIGLLVEAALYQAIDRNLPAVEWPMKVLYRRFRDGAISRNRHSGSHHAFRIPRADCSSAGGCANRCSTNRWRLPPPGRSRRSIQPSDSTRPQTISSIASKWLLQRDAIAHNSWARSPADIRLKIASWSHNQGRKSWLYYYSKWLPAPVTWRSLRDSIRCTHRCGRAYRSRRAFRSYMMAELRNVAQTPCAKCLGPSRSMAARGVGRCQTPSARRNRASSVPCLPQLLLPACRPRSPPIEQHSLASRVLLPWERIHRREYGNRR